MPYPNDVLAIQLDQFSAFLEHMKEGLDKSEDKDTGLLPFSKPADPAVFTSTYIPEYVKEHLLDLEPEKRAAEELDIENLVDVDPKVIDQVEEITGELAEDIKTLLFNEGAAFLISLDEATSYVQAALREGLGIDMEIDSSVGAGVSHLVQLNILSKYLDRMSLSAPIKERLMRKLADKVSKDIHLSMRKSSTSERYSSILQNLQARMSPGEGPYHTAESNPVGVVRGQSKNKANSRHSSEDSEHAKNLEQHSGIRIAK